ncbi:uncharacterized protein K452DRAFT_282605 [Aplosporella prunicola CBS 121167]|uniref:DNA repair metallo-beta-lactamase domain-containing protein n=1 Tax=Aplosporella prunicola CBS 121167 TaxID=1176127 RepID=A0A6A6BSM2_9PEZI|nr:uncharacterized protein K452DRAFT_282605 [Aplosporella prunicola CBS 121167]KAF2146433.1 hypothetical protein K452DRAFT_282605 [Aplosporella prunicola CBS 121167]
MFRNPRENIHKPPSQRLAPSVGRPPSPPAASPRTAQAQPPLPAPKPMATKTMTPRPWRSSQKPKQTKLDFSKSSKGGIPRSKVKPNASILSFFKKTDGPVVDDPGLFLEDRGKARAAASITIDDDEEEPAGWEDKQGSEDGIADDRFNESSGSNKRRKISDASEDSPKEPEKACSPPPPEVTQPMEEKKSVKRPSGPFFEDSDSEDETPPLHKSSPKSQSQTNAEPPLKNEANSAEEVGEDSNHLETKDPPPLKHEPTSFADDGFADFEGIEDFDEFDEGEELDARVWAQEQKRLEMAEFDLEDIDADDVKAEPGASSTTMVTDAPICPICNANLDGISEKDASVHVNNCLDGNPTPLPTNNAAEATTASSPHRFQRPPKPAQKNPFTVGESSTGSAFTKLMSGHAEDAAWANAAAAEHAARGKPSYQRTCPFYKILPGFFICVDAFRYGAVKGCNAYFLSHFHSDHYVGLTASWKHGPIYCSKVTANLVLQQLRVDPKWVVALDWEQETEVPGTGGANVTMIPANHCPGSSLFLFEKAIGSGKNPKTQRILHCGDFRACRAHIEHPLLRPDVMDAVSGKTRQQKIDVCYLDTTYLDPKYAFPSQEDVIKACADMCVSLNKERIDETDSWEQMKRERAGKGMVNFVHKDSEPSTTDTETARGKLLVVVGTYSIGKERICLGIARALNSKIYAPPAKQRICAMLEDPELSELLTTDPRAAQVHMTPLFEIRGDTLADYLTSQGGAFARAVGFRPSGWSYRGPAGRQTDSPQVSAVLRAPAWRSRFAMKDLVPQRGSTRQASYFAVPYSEHSSFAELTRFCCGLRIERVVPTVNVGSAKSREKMKTWCDRWAAERRKNGVFRLEEGEKW